MLLTLLLDFSAADAKSLGKVVWGLALVSWLPQLLVGWLVLRTPRPVLTQLLLLLSPLLLLATISYLPALLLLFFIYSDVQWLLWLPVALLPTFGAMFLAVDRRGQQPAVAPPAAAPAPDWVRWAAGGGVFVLLVAGITWWARPRHEDPDEPVPAEWKQPVSDELQPLWQDTLYEQEQRQWEQPDKRAQRRADSLRFMEQNPEQPAQRW